MSATAKIIILKGDSKKPESAEHIIKFPGGSISVCRTSDNEYWAHIEVNVGEIITETVRSSKQGQMVGSRLDYKWPAPKVKQIPDVKNLTHLAVRIKNK